jgi:hypothetical protein
MHSSLYVQPVPSEDEKLKQRQAEYLREQDRETKHGERARAAAEVAPLTFWKAVFAVFLGNLMFGTLAAIFYSVATAR